MNTGDVLGSGSARVRIVGVRDGAWLLEPLGAFGPIIERTPAELAAEFDCSAEPPPVVDENQIWLEMDRRWLDAVCRDAPEPEPLLTPEEKLATEAAAK
jgi:hypothetical protein